MKGDFVKMLEKLQKKIEYVEEQKYSKVVINECRNPSNFGIIRNPDVYAEIKGPCGDTMKICFNVNSNHITDACFWTDGCGATIACGSLITKMLKDKNLADAKKITYTKLLKTLDGLPKEHQHCAKLTTNTLKKAIENYNRKIANVKKDIFENNNHKAQTNIQNDFNLQKDIEKIKLYINSHGFINISHNSSNTQIYEKDGNIIAIKERIISKKTKKLKINNLHH